MLFPVPYPLLLDAAGSNKPESVFVVVLVPVAVVAVVPVAVAVVVPKLEEQEEEKCVAVVVWLSADDDDEHDLGPVLLRMLCCFQQGTSFELALGYILVQII